MFTADQHSVGDDEFVVAHGLILVPSPPTTQDIPEWVEFGCEKRACTDFCGIERRTDAKPRQRGQSHFR